MLKRIIKLGLTGILLAGVSLGTTGCVSKMFQEIEIRRREARGMRTVKETLSKEVTNPEEMMRIVSRQATGTYAWIDYNKNRRVEKEEIRLGSCFKHDEVKFLFFVRRRELPYGAPIHYLSRGPDGVTRRNPPIDKEDPNKSFYFNFELKEKPYVNPVWREQLEKYGPGEYESFMCITIGREVIVNHQKIKTTGF